MSYSKTKTLTVLQFVAQVYSDGEPLSTPINDYSITLDKGQPFHIQATHASFDIENWLPILTAPVPRTHAPGAPEITVTVAHDAPVWVEREAFCGECMELGHQEGWKLAPNDGPTVVTRCSTCGFYNWYSRSESGVPGEDVWELKYNGDWVALGAKPLGKIGGM